MPGGSEAVMVEQWRIVSAYKRRLTRLAMLFVVAFASSYLTHHYLILPPVNLAPIDPLGGIALAATLLWGRRAAATVGIATLAGWLASGVLNRD